MEYLIGALFGYIACHAVAMHSLADHVSRGVPLEIKGKLFKLEEVK